MAINFPRQINRFYDLTQTMGDRNIFLDATIEIEGFKSTYLVASQFPMPFVSTVGVIAIPSPLGTSVWQPAAPNFLNRSQIILREQTTQPLSETLLQTVISKQFNAVLYDGSPDRFQKAYKLHECKLEHEYVSGYWETPKRPWEYRGLATFNYLGECWEGSI